MAKVATNSGGNGSDDGDDRPVLGPHTARVVGKPARVPRPVVGPHSRKIVAELLKAGNTSSGTAQARALPPPSRGPRGRGGSRPR